jgi:biotin synthase
MLDRTKILDWLREDRDERLAELWCRADETRRRHVGDAVHLRGLVELSNHCVRQCTYCGLRAGNREIVRYRLTADQILDCAHQAVRLGYGTVVLQSGEDLELTAGWIADVVRRIRDETSLAVTLSLGERSPAELALWKDAGADRYLLRFETSNPRLFKAIHPPRSGQPFSRPELLRIVRLLGYEVGSGIMIGIPGQSHDDLADDLRLMQNLDLDMIGVGPYLPHPETPLGRHAKRFRLPGGGQVPNDERTTYKIIALVRLLRPRANIPSTTALATINPVNGRELGLQRGANVIMPNITPVEYRESYQIYPDKTCIRDTASACHQCVQLRIRRIGRTPGSGRGDSPNHRQRHAALSVLNMEAV